MNTNKQQTDGLFLLTLVIKSFKFQPLNNRLKHCLLVLVVCKDQTVKNQMYLKFNDRIFLLFRQWSTVLTLKIFVFSSTCWLVPARTFQVISTGCLRKLRPSRGTPTAWWSWAAASPKMASTRRCAGSRSGKRTSSRETSTGDIMRRNAQRTQDIPNPSLCGRECRKHRRGPSSAGRDVSVEQEFCFIKLSVVTFLFVS